MAIMGSSKRNKIFDPVRQEAFAARPEEVVRQKLLHHMMGTLEYPKHTLLVEKELKQLPHLSQMPSLPDRRADVICLVAGIHANYPLYPLLLIECKEDEIDQKAVDQLVGYNHFVQAYFIAAVGRTETRFGYFDPDQGKYRFLSHLPRYVELMQAFKKQL
jgi:hypothetical protein